MRELNFTEEELKEAIRGNYINCGSECSIYQYKKYIALKLYDIDDSIYNPFTGKLVGKAGCESMIKNLLLYKDNIKLTSFPIGVVKQNNVVVGQIIKYYNNSETLTSFLLNHPEENPIEYYLKILDILEELTQNNIIYEDIHGGNFLIVNNSAIKIIDFSDYRVKINENFNGMYYNMFQNFCSMVNNINLKDLKLTDTYKKMVLPYELKNDIEHVDESFDYIREQLNNLELDKNKSKTL